MEYNLCSKGTQRKAVYTQYRLSIQKFKGNMLKKEMDVVAFQPILISINCHQDIQTRTKTKKRFRGPTFISSTVRVLVPPPFSQFFP